MICASRFAQIIIIIIIIIRVKRTESEFSLRRLLTFCEKGT